MKIAGQKLTILEIEVLPTFLILSFAQRCMSTALNQTQIMKIY